MQAAAEAKIPSGTVLRVETDVDHGSPYEAHVQKADGTQVEVLVDSSFTVTAVNAMPQHPDPGPHDSRRERSPATRPGSSSSLVARHR